MQARRRFHDADESVALIVNEHEQQLTSDADEAKKYSAAPSSSSSYAWNLAGYLPKQLTQAVYTPLQHLQQFHQQTVVPQLNASPVRHLIDAHSRYSTSAAAAAAADCGGGQENDGNDDDDNSAEEPIAIEIEVMASRDRTLEFSNAIRTLQSRNIARAVNVRDPKKATQLQSYSEFMMIAKHVGKNIASTYTKLEKLTLLAKRKSLFDDRPAEIQELTYIIKGDLNSLNQQIARLQEVSKSQRKTNSGKHLLSHSSNMVLALQAKLANMSTDFKQILEVRTENLKHQKTRRDQFSQGPVASNLPPASMRDASQGGGSLLLSEQQRSSNQQQQQQQQQHRQQHQVTIDFDDPGTAGHGESQALLPQGTYREQQQQQSMIMYDESDNYVQQRAETMQNIESTIVELGGIFQQLAHMVKEQEEMVERIDTNVQDAEMNVEAAHGQILKYFQSVTNNRWLMVKIFGVLIAFFIFFVIFLA